MINKYLASQIKSNFPFNPTDEQEKTLELISEFILSDDDRKLFMLCGYAGTGREFPTVCRNFRKDRRGKYRLLLVKALDANVTQPKL